MYQYVEICAPSGLVKNQLFVYMFTVPVHVVICLNILIAATELRVIFIVPFVLNV